MTDSEKLIKNLGKVRELNREFLQLAKQGRYREADRILKQLESIELYETRRGRGRK